MDPLRIVSLESRRASELARLLERNGISPIQAPSMREVPLSDQTEALEHVDALIDGEFDVLVLLTGVGFEMLCQVVATRYPRERFVETLARRPIMCRGPKPVAVLKRMGLSPTLVAPEPNTWRELLAAIDGKPWPLAGKRLVLQEYGVRNQALLDGLTERGARVQPIPIYAWQLPEDTGPLRDAVSALCEGQADGVLLTSQQQLDHLFQVAAMEGLADPLREALSRRLLVASIGPVTSEALVARGVCVDIEPQHPKMGHLVQCLVRDGRNVLDAKRAST